MSKEKAKSGIQLESKERTVTTPSPELISFDVYFQLVMKRDSKVYPHHKAPMRNFAIQHGLSDAATIEEYDKVFRAY